MCGLFALPFQKIEVTHLAGCLLVLILGHLENLLEHLLFILLAWECQLSLAILLALLENGLYDGLVEHLLVVAILSASPAAGTGLGALLSQVGEVAASGSIGFVELTPIFFSKVGVPWGRRKDGRSSVVGLSILSLQTGREGLLFSRSSHCVFSSPTAVTFVIYHHRVLCMPGALLRTLVLHVVAGQTDDAAAPPSLRSTMCLYRRANILLRCAPLILFLVHLILNCVRLVTCFSVLRAATSHVF